MIKRIYVFMTFVRFFVRYVLLVREVLGGLLIAVCLSGVMIGIAERRPWGESLYFAFITALSIGYGDVSPITSWGRIGSVIVGCIGMVFIGLTVAVATRALSDTVDYLKNDSEWVLSRSVPHTRQK